eukprot:SAG11_NODE_3228_length_2596_cov_2.794954_1_plen_65_part_00
MLLLKRRHEEQGKSSTKMLPANRKAGARGRGLEHPMWLLYGDNKLAWYIANGIVRRLTRPIHLQ